jgi:hypothetical protein
MVTANNYKFWPLKADSHIACLAHAIPLSCRAAKGLECVFPIWFAQYGRAWFTLAMPCPCRSPAMPCRKWFRMCLSHLICTVRPCLTYTCHTAPMPCSDHAVLLKATAQHGRREKAWGLPARVRLLSATTRSSTKVVMRSILISRRSIPTTVKTDISTLQKRRPVKLLD